jgi:uncharacterized protein YndB with AHSA1/START domain
MSVALVHQVNIKATPDSVYKAISTQEGLSSFWTDDTKAESKVGSVASFGFGGPSQRMRVDELAPGKRVKWTGLPDFPNWENTTVTWDIKPADNGQTSVTFGHRDWPASVTAHDLGSINYTWGMIVDRLRQYAETGKPVPYVAFARR